MQRITHSNQLLPDRIFSAIAIDPAIVKEDDISFQISIVVVGRVVVGHHSRWDAETTQDLTKKRKENKTKINLRRDWTQEEEFQPSLLNHVSVTRPHRC